MDRCTQYALDVVAGKTVAGETVKLACRRHLDDLEHAKLAVYAYCYDEAQAADILDFAENLVIAEGEEQTRVELYPFQCFILGSLNGWRKKEGGCRRYRTSYIQLGRQNGKSFLNGILAAYYGNFTAYRYPKIFCTATKQDQANIVFAEITKFIRSDKDLEECFRIHDHNYTIDCLLTDGTIRAISGDTKSLDGHRCYLGIVDEYHAHETNQMYKLLEGGIKKMRSALISVITTAGFNLNGPCYELYDHCKTILKGGIQIESQFIFIAELDEGDDLWLPRNWLKANPALAYDPEALENMKPIAVAARAMGGDDLKDFLVKQLNMWLQVSEKSYIRDADALRRCGTDRTLADFRGSACYVGLDLSSGGDLTTVVIVIPWTENGRKRYFISSHSFIPARRLQEHIDTDLAPYDLWVQKKLITVTQTMGGIKTDYKYILAYLKKLIAAFRLQVRLICYDPHNASAFLQDLEETGFDSLEIYQSPKSLSDATEDFRLEIMAGNVEFNKGEELLIWSILNARVVTNSYGEIKIDKEMARKRIDPVDAVIDAWKMAMGSDAARTADEAVAQWLELYGRKKQLAVEN